MLGEERVELAHKRIGYVHERPIFETRFTGRTYLRYLGKLSGLWGKEGEKRADEVLEQVQLVDAASRGVGTYSISILMVVVTVILSLPVATRKIQIIFLAWLATALYVAENNRDGSTAFLQFIHAPLAPLSACYNLGQNSTINGSEFMLVLLAILYIVILVYCAESLLARRDLLLQ